MSEFTDGVLFLRKYIDKAQDALQSLGQPHRIGELNQQWAAIFVENANPKVDPLRSWMIEQSSSFPLLFFEHGEDHGWGYRIFNEGQEKASLFVDYELSYNIYIDYVEREYPGIDPHVGLERDKARAIQESIIASDAFKQRVQSQYRNANIEQFTHFEIDEEVLQELRSILTVEWYLDSMFRQVAEFKRLLNIREMSWISYRYLTMDE